MYLQIGEFAAYKTFLIGLFLII